MGYLSRYSSVFHMSTSPCAMLLNSYLKSLPDDMVDVSELQDIYRNAAKHVRASRLTDAELIYAPSQIALSSFSVVSPGLARAWALSKGSSAILPVIDDITSMITADGQAPDVERVREVDKRLRICKNPEKIVGSKAYLAKKAADEARDQEKRSKKAEETRRNMDADDPFGDELGSGDGVDPNLDDDD